MSMLSYLSQYKGHKVVLHTRDGLYEGTVFDVCEKLSKVTLLRVVLLPGRKSYSKSLSFSASDIIKYSVLFTDRQSSPAGKSGPSLPNSPNRSSDSMGSNSLLDSDVLVTSEDEQLATAGATNGERGECSLLHELLEKTPDNYTFIDRIDGNFHEAIQCIKKQEEIGVSFQGDNMERFSGLYLLSISTESRTFIFDIHELRKLAFERGLKDILESKEIKKVIHDSRQPSDTLCHLYDTRLTYVFDTQVGFFFAECHNSQTDEVSEEARTLDYCLSKYFGSPQKAADRQMQHEPSHWPSKWASRPLPASLRDEAIRSAIFPRVLMVPIMEGMMKSFYGAIDIYLNVLRDASLDRLTVDSQLSHLLPSTLLDYVARTFKMRTRPNLPTRRGLGFHSNGLNVAKRSGVQGEICEREFYNVEAKPDCSKHCYVTAERENRSGRSRPQSCSDSNNTPILENGDSSGKDQARSNKRSSSFSRTVSRPPARNHSTGSRSGRHASGKSERDRNLTVQEMAVINKCMRDNGWYDKPRPSRNNSRDDCQGLAPRGRDSPGGLRDVSPTQVHDQRMMENCWIIPKGEELVFMAPPQCPPPEDPSRSGRSESPQEQEVVVLFEGKSDHSTGGYQRGSGFKKRAKK